MSIKRKISKLRAEMLELIDELDVEIGDLEDKETLTEKQEEKLDNLNEIKEVIETACDDLAEYDPEG